jgi:hypothetical protein
MTTADLAVRDPQPAAIPAKLQYARALAESGLLPSSYRKNPANVLWAAEYGDMLGIGTMAAITGVHVIEGKPTASAGLISALVRRAGHKLRVHGDADAATCQIVRSDDPGYTFEVTFTAKDAQAAGLLSKDVWKKYRPSMLKARAITQCARDACEEALFGLHYTAEELGANVDEDGVVIGELEDEPDEALRNGQSAAAQLLGKADAVTTDEAAGRVTRAAADARLKGRITREQCDQIQNTARARVEALRQAATPVDVEDLARQAAAGEPEPDYDTPGTATTPQIGAIWTVLTTVFKFGKDEKDQARAVCSRIAKRTLASTKDMSRDEAKAVLDVLASWRETAEQNGEQPREFLIELMATAENGDGDG